MKLFKIVKKAADTIEPEVPYIKKCQEAIMRCSEIQRESGPILERGVYAEHDKMT